jgi:peptidoglycan/xylan/chitin deacetylase (PgdA/CDA1 family)
MIPYRNRIQRLMAEHFAHKPATREVRTPIISFTFDDFPRSALTVGGEMLSANGKRGTFYGSMGLIGEISKDAGTMLTRADLDDLLANGHELACHTYSHTSCLAVKTVDYVEECTRNRQQASELLDGYGMKNLSFPYGHVTLAAKRMLQGVYDTCRSTEPGINLDPIDLSFLRANPLYSRLEISNVKQLIEQNVRSQGWLILYTHDVALTPSAYGCTPRYFESVLRCALASGAEILPVRDAAARYVSSMPL